MFTLSPCHLVTLSFLAAAALGLLWVFFPRIRPPDPSTTQPPNPPSDPRQTYDGPFRNVAPAVRYVPEERCADCHRDLATSFAGHPMGRSLVTGAVTAPEGPW